MDTKELANNYRNFVIKNSPFIQWNSHLVGTKTPFINHSGHHIKVYICENEMNGSFNVNDGGWTVDDASDDEVQSIIQNSALKRELKNLHVSISRKPGERVNNTLIETTAYNRRQIPKAMSLLTQGIALISGLIPVIEASSVSSNREETHRQHARKVNTDITPSDSKVPVSRKSTPFSISRISNDNHKKGIVRQKIDKFFKDFFD